MASLTQDKKRLLEKRHEANIKAKDFSTQADILSERKESVEEGISRIPTDLPEELQAQVDSAVENTRKQLKEESDNLAEKIKDAQDDADEALEEMREKGSEYNEKAEKTAAMSGIPLIGSFMEGTSGKLSEASELFYDIAKETQAFSDSLATSRTKLLNK